MTIWLKIISESFILAVKELYATKLRSFLSLLGITIGILCLISVFSAVDSLEKNLRNSIDSLGGDIIYVNKLHIYIYIAYSETWLLYWC
jgi:putative ABC transport system permease protein